MDKQNLVSNYLQRLMCHKTKPINSYIHYTPVSWDDLEAWTLYHFVCLFNWTRVYIVLYTVDDDDYNNNNNNNSSNSSSSSSQKFKDYRYIFVRLFLNSQQSLKKYNLSRSNHSQYRYNDCKRYSENLRSNNNGFTFQIITSSNIWMLNIFLTKITLTELLQRSLNYYNFYNPFGHYLLFFNLCSIPFTWHSTFNDIIRYGLYVTDFPDIWRTGGITIFPFHGSKSFIRDVICSNIVSGSNLVKSVKD